MPDGQTFNDIAEFQALLVADSRRLLENLAEQFATYSTGRGVAFRDREPIAAIVEKTQQQGGGIRTLIHELVQSRLFQTH